MRHVFIFIHAHYLDYNSVSGWVTVLTMFFVFQVSRDDTIDDESDAEWESFPTCVS